MRKMVIMSGIAGSGKSTAAKEFLVGPKVCRALNLSDIGTQLDANPTSVLLSADDYFVQENGVYKFNAGHLSLAHCECFRCGITACQREVPIIVVDNTNTTAAEIAPYYLLGESFGYDVTLYTMIHADDMLANDYIEACFLRNTHGCPEAGVRRQYDNMLNRTLPPWWGKESIVSKF